MFRAQLAFALMMVSLMLLKLQYADFQTFIDDLNVVHSPVKRVFRTII